MTVLVIGFHSSTLHAGKVVAPEIQFRFKIRISCKVKIAGDCVGLNRYSMLYSISQWLEKLSGRWGGKLFGKKGEKVKCK